MGSDERLDGHVMGSAGTPADQERRNPTAADEVGLSHASAADIAETGTLVHGFGHGQSDQINVMARAPYRLWSTPPTSMAPRGALQKSASDTA